MVKLLSAFILALLPFFFNGSYNFIIDVLNYLIEAFATASIAIVELFPASPNSVLLGPAVGSYDMSSPDAGLLSDSLNALAWLVPMTYLSSLVGAVLLAVVAYFTIAPLARWFKLLT